MTTLVTVDFGNITPVRHTARVLVTVQMALDLIALAVTARLLSRTASGEMLRRAKAE